jgi:hypothetical protein
LAEKPLLDALNRLPGKTRRRWILLPFSFIAGKLEFTVSLRLFLNPHPGVSGKAAFPERLCADLKVSVPPGSSSGERSRRWVIVLERTEAEGAAPQIRAELSLFKAPGKEGGFSEFVFSSPEKKRLIKELAGALDLPCSMVVIKDGASPFADSMDDALQTINEEV